jgi:two-component system, NarL family, nitrate/nitrite response regulator NarL
LNRESINLKAMQKIKILLADDHKLVMNGFKNLLAKYRHLDVVGEAKDGREALQFFEKRNPDIVLMDMNMPGLNGIEATVAIKKKKKEARVIILSMHHEPQYIINADMAGAAAYLLKNIDEKELIHAIHVVMEGGNYYSKGLSAALVDRVRNKKYIKTGEDQSLLTRREKEILKAIALGLTNKEIADKLFISDRTVNSHRTNIYQKLDVNNAAELVAKAMEKKIL